jgi:methionyl-tRNA formyltransferase
VLDPGSQVGDAELAAWTASSPAGLMARDARLVLVCAEGALELLEVKPAGGRAMDAAAYLRGHSQPGRA